MSREACIELARTLGVDADALVEQWSERAAIREVDGGQPRADAERDALDDVRLMVRKGPRSAGAVVIADGKRRTSE
jgi:hypothetical protein